MMSSDDRYMLLKGYMGTCTVYGYMYSVWVHVQCMGTCIVYGYMYSMNLH